MLQSNITIPSGSFGDKWHVVQFDSASTFAVSIFTNFGEDKVKMKQVRSPLFFLILFDGLGTRIKVTDHDVYWGMPSQY